MAKKTFRFGFFVVWMLTAVFATSSAVADGKNRPRLRPYVSQLYVSLTPSDMGQVEAIRTRSSVVLAPDHPAVVEHRVAIDPAALGELRRAGIAARVLDSDFQRLVDESYARWLTPSRAEYAGELPAWFDQAQPLDAVYSYLDELAKSAPDRASVRSLGKAYKNEVKAIRISSAAADGNRGSVLVSGTFHAREWLSPMVVMGYVWNLIKQYDSDPVVKKVVDNLNIYIVPVQNPDGYVETFNGNRMRRTNLSPSCASGVDINRNFPAKDFGKNVGRCGEETYCGPSAGSEPETKATKALGDSFKKPLLYLDVHSPGNAILTPYAANTTTAKMYDEAKAAADLYGSLAGLQTQPAVFMAGASGGGALDYFQENWDNKQGITFAVELPRGMLNEFDIPRDGIPTHVEKNIKAFMAVLKTLAEDNPAGTTGAAGSGGGGTGGAGRSGGAGRAGGAAGAVVAAAGRGAGGNAGANTISANAGAPSDESAGGIAVVGGNGAVPASGSTSDPSLSGTAGQVAIDAVVTVKASHHSSSDCSSVVVGSERSGGKLAIAALAVMFLFARRRRRE